MDFKGFFKTGWFVWVPLSIALIVLMISALIKEKPTPQAIQEQKHNTFVQQAELATKRIFYIQDPQTNLCFAAHWEDGLPNPFAAVPCEKVEHLLATQEAPSP